MIYGYLRKSSEEGVNSSFDTQKFRIKSYCDLNGIKVDEWFEDICSGGLLITQRKQGMLLSSKLEKGDSIICNDLSRYSRSHIGLVNDVEKYRKNKIKLIFCDLGDVISSDSLGSVFYQILSIMSEWYRKSLSEKQKKEVWVINKTKALKIVKKDGLDLKNLPTHFKKDREIVLAAVRSDGFAIADADSNFLDDKEIAIEAIKNNTGTFLLLNKKLTMDKDILTLVGLEKHIKKGEKWS
jgi:DNA invertase Pin-like site-specific DNA recombinase